VEYLHSVDTASPHSGDLALSLPSSQAPVAKELFSSPQIPAALFEELWLTSQAEAVQLSRSEFAAKLTMVGAKRNHGLSNEAVPSTMDVESFFRALHLPDLALAHACALGREVAWERFLTLYRRSPLRYVANPTPRA
jgi:RNA polymerase sigma-70 factor (ECF subfamily)